MKYILMDTNIYLDMLVDRRNNVSSNLVSNFKKLLDFDEIKLIVPKIVVYEVNKHLEEQLSEVGKTIGFAIKSIDEVHDICGLPAENLNLLHHRQEAKKQITALKERFEKNKDAYLVSLTALIDSIFTHRNCIVLEDDDKIRSLCVKRRIYKRAPFHIKGKESFADGTIVATLMCLKEYVAISDGDDVIFVTGNTSDFSEKGNKRVLHRDIIEDLSSCQLDKCITYTISFNELVGVVLKSEVENAKLREEFEKDLQKSADEEREHQLAEFIDMKREIAGLSALDGFEDIFLEDFAESDFVSVLLSLFEQINECYDLLEELFLFYEEELIGYVSSLRLNDVDEFIKRWNSVAEQSSFPKAKADIGGLVEIVECVKDKAQRLDYSEISDRLPDFINYGEKKSFYALNKKQYTLVMEELFLSCQDGEVDWLEVSLVKDNQQEIAKGTIEITYGYANYNIDGNIDDSCDQDVEYFTYQVECELIRIVEEFEAWVLKEKEAVEILSKGLGINH